MRRKGVISYFIVFVLVSVILVFLFGFATPFLIAVDEAFYTAGEDILNNIDVSDIQDTNIRASVNASLEASKSSVADQIDYLTFFHRFGWLIFMLVIALIMFMFSRESVETNAY